MGHKVIYEISKQGTITKDGHTMFGEDIVSDLNRKSYLETENKSLKENLQAIAGSTQDSEEPLTKCIHGIAIKHLNK